MPVNWKNYPSNWKYIRRNILSRARNCCEQCGAENAHPHPITGSKVVLTIAHVDHDTTNNDPENLRAWCQKCHLAHDAKLHVQHAFETRRAKQHAAGQLEWDFDGDDAP